VRDTIRLGRILGIPVGTHWSVLVIVALIVWALTTGWFPERLPEASEAARYAAATVAAVGLLGSLLVHELAHALLARRHGVQVEGITLWVLGGVTRLQTTNGDPRVELRVAVVGPLTSLAIAALAGTVWLVLQATALGVAGEVALWLALVNTIVGVFNLVPAFPLDGGRAYRAWVWQRTGDRTAATRRAATVGRGFGHGLVALGLLELLLLGAVGGIWLAMVGWFIGQAASAEESQVAVSAALGGLRVADLMTPDPVTAPNWWTVDRFIDTIVTRGRVSTYPLIDLDGRVTGLVTLRRLASVPPTARASMRISEVAAGLDAITISQPDEPAIELLRRLPTAPGARALVFDHDRLVGIVSPTDVARTLEIALLRDDESSAPAATNARLPPESSDAGVATLPPPPPCPPRGP
jgi:Zn-dependent protease